MTVRTPPVGQHPATHDAWAWLDENRATLDQERANRIDTTLREISSEFWEWERSVRRADLRKAKSAYPEVPGV